MQSLSKLTSSMRNYIYLDNEISSILSKIKSYDLVKMNASYYKEKNQEGKYVNWKLLTVEFITDEEFIPNPVSIIMCKG